MLFIIANLGVVFILALQSTFILKCFPIFNAMLFPATILIVLDVLKKFFPKSQEIEDRGFFIGLPTHPMSKEKINYLVEKLVGFDGF